jgi:hypothetical protein
VTTVQGRLLTYVRILYHTCGYVSIRMFCDYYAEHTCGYASIHVSMLLVPAGGLCRGGLCSVRASILTHYQEYLFAMHVPSV